VDYVVSDGVEPVAKMVQKINLFADHRPSKAVLAFY